MLYSGVAVRVASEVTFDVEASRAPLASFSTPILDVRDGSPHNGSKLTVPD